MNLLDLIMTVLLIASMVYGYRRGFIQQTVRFLGTIVALVIAFRYRHEAEPIIREWLPFPLSGKEGEWLWLSVFNVEHLYYSLATFLLLFLIIKLGVSIVARILEVIARLPGLNLANKSLGMLVGILKMGLILFIVTHVLFFLPWETGQSLLSSSKLGLWFMDKSPILSTLAG